MCGIAGFMGFDEPGLIERMTASIRHRGPDGDGFHHDPRAPLRMGMRRLSIIDLEGGWQPIANEDGSVVVMQNGEIYNYVELTEELTALGHAFRTRSDTEVIAHAYEQWGADCVRRFNGMFALAVWDRGTQELLLARDRCGQKPLYWWQGNGRFVFASEVKAILESQHVPRACNVGAIDPYLALRYVPEPETMFEGVFTLRAGHTLRIKSGQAPRIERYWDVPLTLDGPVVRDEEWLERLQHKLADAVRLTLRSDVPVGAYLSAGVDSSLIVANMVQLHGQVRTFSIGFGSPEDETRDAAATARLLGTEHEEIQCTSADFALLPRVVYHMDRPVGDALVLAFWKLAECASRRQKVVLSGEGADEMFAGYQFHKLTQLVERWHRLVPAFLHRGVALPLLRAMPSALLDRFFEFPAGLGRQGKARLVDWLGGYAGRDLFANYLALRTLWSTPERRALYTEQYRACATEAWMPQAPERGGHFLDRLLALQYREWLQDWALIREDKNAMAHSLEVRCPFLDHELIELAFAMPPHLKAKGLRDKIIERRLAARLLPAEVVRRPKNPFFLPMARFYRDPRVRDLIRDCLEPGRVRRRGYFDPDRVRVLVERMDAGEFVGLKQVMSLVILELWHRVFLDREVLW